MRQPPVGRQQELAEIETFLDRCRWGLHGLLLSGPAGIGKTTLWKAALDRARERGLRVLSCRPTEVETGLSFSALIDLFDELADEVLPTLPDPQRVAVEAALMRSSADPSALPLGISLGVLAMIRSATQGNPLLLAIDDAPWLDDSSARVLDFALRRLEDAPVGLIASQRTETARAGIPGVVAAIPPERRSSITVTPASVDELAEIVNQALGINLRRPVLLRIHQLSAGNAFYALEVARALARRGDVEGRGELPIPDSLEGLLGDRIDALPPWCAGAMLFAAALSTPTRGVLAAVVGQDEAGNAIAAAEAAGVLDVEGEMLRFSHPLLAAAIYSRAAPDDRRAAHRALAAVVRDTEERARHLARSADAPDEAVAAALEDAARAARSRGAGVAAAELAEASVRVTPDTEPEARRRRMMAGADHHLAAGDVPRAVSTLERLARDTEGTARAPILVALGETLLHTSDRAGAGRAFAEALAAAGEDLALRVRTELGLAGVAHLTWVDWRAGEQHATNALRAAEQLGDPDLLLQAIGHQATWSFQMGHGVPRDLMARARALPDPGETLPLMDHPDHQFGGILEAVGELEDARDRLERLLALARSRRAWYSLPWILMRLARVELAAGSWRQAEEQLDEGRSVAQQSGQDAAVGYLGQVEVQLLALRGDVDRCRSAAAQSMRISEQMGIPHRMTAVVSASALLDLSVRDPGAAFRRLEPFLALDAPGRAEPALLRPMVPLAVEALIGLGRLDEAEAVLAPFEALARQHRRSIALADAGRCRAMLMAARGDLGGAREAAEPARHGFERLGLPFDAARASLTLAEILRRAKQKSAARQAAGAALSAFETLGAQRWTERAREELARTDARRTPGAELTETEQRIVDLLAAGRTNREIAGTLFMSVHTVEAHLTRIYRSLGVRSRTELARRVLDRGAGGSSRSSEGES